MTAHDVLLVIGTVVVYQLFQQMVLAIQAQRVAAAVETAAKKHGETVEEHNQRLLTAVDATAEAVKKGDTNNEKRLGWLNYTAVAFRRLLEGVSRKNQRRQEMQIDLLVMLIAEMRGLRTDLRRVAPGRFQDVPEICTEAEAIRRQIDSDRAPSIAAQELQELLLEAEVPPAAVPTGQPETPEPGSPAAVNPPGGKPDK